MSTIDGDRQRAREWLLVAISALGLAGVLAGGLVFARTPPLARFVTDPAFFKRCLVVHVDLALVVWFYAFVAALFALIPSRVRSTAIARHGSVFAVLGVACMLGAAGISGTRPILANYIPVIDHPLYTAGLVAIGFGLASSFLDPKLLPRNEEENAFMPAAAIVGLRASALAVLIAFVTFFSSRLKTPRDLTPDAYWEQVMWGGGHVLQFASVAAMLAVWTILIARARGRSPVSRRAAVIVFAVLIAPLFAAPFLSFHGFTRLMQLGIAPGVIVYLLLCVRGRVPAAVIASMVLTIAGFALGAAIRGPNTVIPAHYHASIGAVTVAFMAMTVPLLQELGFTATDRVRAIARYQPVLLGGGQLVFAIGFALAGTRRKTYGGEQQIRTLTEWVGLGVMGVGGLVAIAGGVLFLFIVGAMWHRRVAHKRGDTWLRSTGFNG
jgi:cytochrome c oxidase subunit I